MSLVEDIVKTYLYGSTVIPANLADDALIRPSAPTSNPIYAIDAVDFMSTGAGRFALPTQFDVVREFFDTANMLTANTTYYLTGTTNNIFTALGIASKTDIDIEQPFWRDSTDDYIERSFIFGNANFELSATSFYVDSSGNRFINGLKITPQDDNFDFDGAGLSALFNPYLEPFIDPSMGPLDTEDEKVDGIGRTVELIFTNTNSLPIITQYGIADFDADMDDMGDWEFLPTFPIGPYIAGQGVALFQHLWDEGITKFLDEEDRPILYGTDDADVLSADDIGGTYSGVAETLTNLIDDIEEYEANGVVLIGGGGDDTLTGGDNNDVLDGGADTDMLTGGAGDDKFVFNTGDGGDRIMDAEDDDRLVIDGAEVSGEARSMGDGKYLLQSNGQRVVINPGDIGAVFELGGDESLSVDYFHSGVLGIDLVWGGGGDDDSEIPGGGSGGDDDGEGDDGAGAGGGGGSGGGGTPVDFPGVAPGAGAAGDDFDEAEAQTPIAFDLDGDGLEYLARANSPVFFDIDDDHFAEHVEWLGPDDGFLAIDGNSNGIIDGVTELFGANGGTTAWQKLQALDSNASNTLTSADAAWSTLRVWRDADSDGYADTGELLTMADLSITSISTIGSGATTLNGHAIAGASTFVIGGVTRTSADVLLETDQMNSWYIGDGTPESTEIALDTLFLPLSRGYGTLPSLHYAMTQDEDLKELAQELVAIDASVAGGMVDIYDQVDAIILKWAGAEGVNPTSRGAYIDARYLSVLEEINGRDYFNIPTQSANPHSVNGPLLTGAYRAFRDEIAERLLVQGPLADIFRASYDFVQDRVDLSGETLNDIITRAEAAAPEGSADQALYWGAVSGVLTRYYSDLGETLGVVQSAIATAAGFSAAPLVAGTTSSETLTATSGTDTLLGGLGNDVMKGMAGADTYVYTNGDGNDTVDDLDYNTTTIDTLSLGASLTVSGAILTRAGDHRDLTITFSGVSGSVYIHNQFTPYGIERIVFNEGVTWDAQDIRDEYLTRALTTGNDTILGFDDAGDSFSGGAGNDLLRGMGGNDSIYGNEGNDEIRGENGNDSLYGGDGDDLLIGGSGTDTFDGGANIDTVSYSGSAVTINLATNTHSGGDAAGDSISNVENVIGTSNNDTITGNSGNNNLDGAGGNDTLNGGDGDDVITGGTGGDTIDGGNGSDTVSYLGSTSGITINLATNTHSGGQAASDSISNVENVTGSGHGDIIYGNTAANILSGEGNIDTLYGQDGNDTLNGGGSNDTLNGGADNDALNGGDGGDTMYGGTGNDTLAGGTGNDFFVFDTALNATTNNDTITDFSKLSGNTDVIRIDNDIFTAAGSVGTLSASAFYAGAAAADASDRIIYNSTTGALYYDADGTGAAAMVQFALMGASTHPTLSNTDFAVID